MSTGPWNGRPRRRRRSSGSTPTRGRGAVRPGVIAAVVAAAACGLVPAAAPAAPRSHAGRSGATPAAAARLGRVTSRVLPALRGRYEVGVGYPKLYTTTDCDAYSFPVMGTCFANNPAAPYVIGVLPTWPNEYSDPGLRNAFGATAPGESATYRFDPREAVVVFGLMPPAARYLGVQTYVATRAGTFDTTSPTYTWLAATAPAVLPVLFATVPHDPARIQSFSSIGNSTNNVVMEHRSGSSFGTLKAFVATPDRVMARAVARRLVRAGLRARDIFTEPIPTSGLALGLGPSADDFLTLIRYAMPNDPTAGDAWRRALPLTVLRVRERAASHRRPRPFPVPVLDTRSATPEAGYRSAVDALDSAVCLRWGTCGPVASLIDGQSPPINAVGPTCRTIGMNCLADTQDTSYAFGMSLTLDHGEVYALTGVLATKTQNATYVGLSINEASKFEGVANIDDTRLDGSAAAYTAVPNADKLFVYYLTRDCAGLEALTDGRCLSITTDLIPPGGSLKVAARSYVRPGTERGPDSAKLLPPRVMKVARP